MADEEKLSYHDYAAFSFGDEADGSWLFAQVAEAGTFKADDSFYATVAPADFQIKYLRLTNMLNVVSTGQLVPNARLAYFGQIPAKLVSQHAEIYDILRKGEYFKWPGAVDNGL